MRRCRCPGPDGGWPGPGTRRPASACPHRSAPSRSSRRPGRHCGQRSAAMRRCRRRPSSRLPVQSTPAGRGVAMSWPLRSPAADAASTPSHVLVNMAARPVCGSRHGQRTARNDEGPGNSPGLQATAAGLFERVLGADSEVAANRTTEVQRVVIDCTVSARVERRDAVEHVLHRSVQLEGFGDVPAAGQIEGGERGDLLYRLAVFIEGQVVTAAAVLVLQLADVVATPLMLHGPCFQVVPKLMRSFGVPMQLVTSQLPWVPT